VKKALVIMGLMLGVGLLTGGTVKAACNSYFTNIFGYSVREWCTPPSDKGGKCNLNTKTCSNSVPGSVYKFTCEGKSKGTDGNPGCGGGMAGVKVGTGGNGTERSVGDPGCNKTVQIDVFNHDCMATGEWDCNGASVTLGGDMLDFFVYYSNDCPPPACNTGSVVMSVSPNPVSADNQDVHFKITSGDASLYIGNSWTGGVTNCDESNWSDVVCKSTTAGNFSWTHTWKLCRADDTDICSPECKKSVQYRVSPRILNSKKCSVSVGATFSVGQPIAIIADGWGNMGVGKSESVRLWLERADGKAINPLPTGVGNAYVSPQTGNISYRMGECLSTNDQPCNLSKNISSGLAPGAYFLHCDLPTDLEPIPPVGLGSKCSGNPFCQLGLTPPRASGDVKATVTKRETGCDSWVYCNVNRQDRDYFIVAEPKPVGVGITIRNSSGTIVPVETGDRNQICQTIFKSAGVHDRKVKFSVTVSDASGGETINKVSLRLRRGETTIMQVNGIGLTTMAPTYSVTGVGASLYKTPEYSVTGDKLTVTFPIQFRENFGTPFAVDNLGIWAEDETGQKLDWTDGGREFKVWDCKVPVTGTVYDGSDAPLGRPVCPTDGYLTPVEAGIFNALIYKNTTSEKTMTVSGSATYLSQGSNSLIWGGGSYAAKFNGEEGLPGSAPIARLGDKKKSPVPYTCPVTVAAISISQTEIDAYQDGPEAKIDFSFTANQEPWYQTVSGGRLLGVGAIQSMVPPTCKVPGCTPALSIDSTISGTNGIVIAGEGISNIAGCSDSDCKNGFPNNWYRKNKNITDGSISYEGLKTLYYDRKGIGKVVGGGNLSDILAQTGTEKVIFVNGDLTVSSNPPSVPINAFKMYIVKGKVNIEGEVTSVDGMFVVDGAMNVTGENANTLNLNGSIYARGGFVNGRSLGSGDENNEAPSVKVNYRPDFIFSMPAKLAENVYNWREGN